MYFINNINRVNFIYIIFIINIKILLYKYNIFIKLFFLIFTMKYVKNNYRGMEYMTYDIQNLLIFLSIQ